MGIENGRKSQIGIDQSPTIIDIHPSIQDQPDEIINPIYDHGEDIQDIPRDIRGSISEPPDALEGELISTTRGIIP